MSSSERSSFFETRDFNKNQRKNSFYIPKQHVLYSVSYCKDHRFYPLSNTFLLSVRVMVFMEVSPFPHANVLASTTSTTKRTSPTPAEALSLATTIHSLQSRVAFLEDERRSLLGERSALLLTLERERRVNEESIARWAETSFSATRASSSAAASARAECAAAAEEAREAASLALAEGAAREDRKSVV